MRRRESLHLFLMINHSSDCVIVADIEVTPKDAGDELL
jgi:hypothetical protein